MDLNVIFNEDLEAVEKMAQLHYEGKNEQSVGERFGEFKENVASKHRLPQLKILCLLGEADPEARRVWRLGKAQDSKGSWDARAKPPPKLIV